MKRKEAATETDAYALDDDDAEQDEDEDSSFDERKLDELEAAFDADEQDPSEVDEEGYDSDGFLQPSAKKAKKSNRLTERTGRIRFKFPPEWARPAAPLVTDGESLTFHHTETDYECDGMGNNRQATIYLYGITSGENSVAVAVTSFLPYFWVEPKEPILDFDRRLPHLNVALENELKSKKTDANGKTYDRGYLVRRDHQYIVAIEPGTRTSLMDYPPNPKIFYKVTVQIPQFVAPLRNIIEKCGYGLCFEAKLDYKLRFMLDIELAGCQWLNVNNCRRIPPKESKTTCQYEFHPHHGDLASIPLKTKDDNAPMRILSYDIECAGRAGMFPVPEIDPAIQIGAALLMHGEDLERWSVGFSYRECAPITIHPNRIMFWFETEVEMFYAFADLIMHVDPDIFTGYNVDGFDWKYLMLRAKHLGIDSVFNFIGRRRGAPAYLKKSTMTSRAYGTQEAWEAVVPGRFTVDVYRYIKREFKLRSYGLNAVAEEYLGDTKLDIHFSKITPMWNSGPEQRKRLLEYCIKDAILPLRLWVNRRIGLNYVQMSRVTGVLMSYLLPRGQLIKITCLLTRTAKARGVIWPSYIEVSGETYPGGAVITPTRVGKIEEPVVTLDFGSLYPSIMRAENICYSTRHVFASLEEANANTHLYNFPPGNNGLVGFIKPEIFEGIFPLILRELAEARNWAKGMMKTAKTPGQKAVFDALQLALKLVANSCYGFTTSFTIQCLDLARAVTGEGRRMLFHTKLNVESHFTREHGYEFDCWILYGDTDSVFAIFGPVSKERAWFLGAEASALAKKLFKPPHDLATEKMFMPFILMKKKRYLGLKWVKPGHWNALPYDQWPGFVNRPIEEDPNGYVGIDQRGIEIVRRDNARLVGKTLIECINRLLLLNDQNAAITYVHDLVAQLQAGTVSIWDLIITKSITKPFEQYSDATRQPAVELAKRMMERDPTTAPGVGQRVPYVVVEMDKKIVRKDKTGKMVLTDTGVSDKAEDPIWVMEHKLRLDANYYIHKQLLKPLLKLFSPILAPNEDIEELLGIKKKEKGAPPKAIVIYKAEVPKSMPDWWQKARSTAAQSNVSAAASASAKKLASKKKPPVVSKVSKLTGAKLTRSTAYKVLFGPGLQHMMKRTKTISTAGLSEYAKQYPRCLGCKVAHPACAVGGLCPDCNKEYEIHMVSIGMRHMEAEENLEKEHQTCRDCLGPGEDIFLCSNKDCQTFYTRKQALVDIEDLAGKLQSLRN